MSEILLESQAKPTAPSAGQSIVFVDSGSKKLVQISGDGNRIEGDDSKATTATITANAADTYLCGIPIPSGGLQAGMIFEWEFTVSKTAAGVATPLYTIRTGANQSTADAQRQQLTGVLQSAAADNGTVRVKAVVRVGGAAAVLQTYVELRHNLATTGLASGATSPAGYNMVQNTSAAFDSTAMGGQFIGLSVHPGTAGVWTVEQVTAYADY